MSGGARRRAAVVGALLALGLTFSASVAEAEIVPPQSPPPEASDGWQAGTCYSDSPAEECSIDTPKLFFEQSAGHPQKGFTQVIVKHNSSGVPAGNIRTIRVDLPAGLSVNPQATPEQCVVGAGQHPDSSTCPPDTKVGESFVTIAELLGIPMTLNAPVYNIVPKDGEPARFGFNLLGSDAGDVYLEAGVDWSGDYHEYFTIHAANLEKEGLPLGPLGELLSVRLLKNRLVFDGRSGNGTFITTPTTCYDHESTPFAHVYSTFLRADSYEEPDPGFPAGSPFIESELPPNTNPKECDTVPYDPSLGVNPGTARTDSPAGPTVNVDVPFEVPSAAEILQERTKQASSQTKRARVTLPLGMGINPSAAGGGLQTCTDAQFGKGTRNPVACPPASKIGTAEVDTPPLPDGSLKGNVYVGQQLSRDPASGDEYRIFVDVESSRYAISARLIGNVSADPTTGQLTTTFDDGELGGLPQVPFSSFRLDFDDGDRAVLTSPGACGPNKATAVMTPWTGNPPATPSGEFTLSTAPGGGECPKALGDRPFAPSFAAGTANHQAGAYSPLHMDIGRSDGNQELKGVDVTLPPGLTAKLAGVDYCPGPAIAAAAAVSGVAQEAHSSCPGGSLIGKADVAAGSGPSPIHIQGKVFLAGPYKGAPLSLAVITPATAGPFDLGTVVVRVALFVDPRTAQVRAQSDPIPHVYGGATLDIRSIGVTLDRKSFSLNPTSCSPPGFGGSLLGGGANPTDPGAFSSTPVSAAFPVAGCDKLGFAPKIFLRLFGASRRAKNPKLRAVLLARGGDANIARAATILPRSLILDQGNLSKVCTRIQFAAGDCPKSSIYGFARAFSPLLDKPLEGPVFLRSSDNTLPDLVSDLHGQVDIELDSRTDSVHGRIRNTFDTVPDVPVSKFVLTLRGGKKGLLVNSRNQCPRKRSHGGTNGGQAHQSKAKSGPGKAKGQRAIVRFKAQNGKKLNLRPRLRAPCGKHGSRHH